MTSKGSASGVAAVSLPFTAADITNPGSAVLAYGVNFASGYNPPDAAFAATGDTTTASIYTTTGGSSLTEGQFNNNTDFIGSLTYHTA